MSLLKNLLYPFERPTPPPARTPMGFFTDTTLCIGCKACEVACKQWNQLPSDGFVWTGDSYDNTGTLSATSWRHVAFIEQFPDGAAPGTYNGSTDPAAFGAEQPPSGGFDLDALLSQAKDGRWLMMSDVCKHCSAAPCQIACPTGAIIHNEFADVYIQNDICNGCGYCVAACPFGVITRNAVDGHAHKCTLCYDRQRDGLVPACAKACPTESIQFGPIGELRERARKRVGVLHQRGETDAYLYGDQPTDTYPSLHAFFLLLDEPSRYRLPDNPEVPQLHLAGDYLRAAIGALLMLSAAIVAMLTYAV
jgi:formate dehydrogenase iron-sulfur subunit